jgi:hypothetical protein
MKFSYIMDQIYVVPWLPQINEKQINDFKMPTFVFY